MVTGCPRPAWISAALRAAGSLTTTPPSLGKAKILPPTIRTSPPMDRPTPTPSRDIRSPAACMTSSRPSRAMTAACQPPPTAGAPRTARSNQRGVDVLLQGASLLVGVGEHRGPGRQQQASQRRQREADDDDPSGGEHP